MDSTRRRVILVSVIAALLGIGAGIALGLAEDDGEQPADVLPAPSATAPEEPLPAPRAPDDERPTGGSESELPPPEEDPQGLEPGPSGPRPESEDERAAASAARAYVEAINERDGAAFCREIAPGVIGAIDLPAGKGSCPSRIDASLGFEGSRGQPVWASSEMTDDVAAVISGDSARVVATVFTRYADIREPTIEDDIIYLERVGNDWDVVKPSATLYRAVGIADVPLEALQPPE